MVVTPSFLRWHRNLIITVEAINLCTFLFHDSRGLLNEIRHKWERTKDDEEGKAPSRCRLRAQSRKSMPQSNHTSYNYMVSSYYLHIFTLEYATYCNLQYTHPAKI